ATNVLSFPVGEPGGTRGIPRLLGDIVIAYETTQREARAEHKPFMDHLMHLAVHGFLHLAGYDHTADDQAAAMERLEAASPGRHRGPPRCTRPLSRARRRLASMPDPEPPSSSEPSATRNLPVPVPRRSQGAPTHADNWFTRALRAMFRWKASTFRADLRDVLEDGAGETGFSPTERAMLKNILVLRERRVSDVMVPRADIIGV